MYGVIRGTFSWETRTSLILFSLSLSSQWLKTIVSTGKVQVFLSTFLRTLLGAKVK